MSLRLEREDLSALADGFALLGSGGGGSPQLVRLVLEHSATWPVLVDDVEDLDPMTPCVAVSYVGSTLLLEERLPDESPFAAAVAAVERWLGIEPTAVCSVEVGGLNGFAALHLAGERRVLDADCMGRALPDLDQISLLVDGLPGLVAAVPTGAGGVALVDGARSSDVERVLRTALDCNGGSAGMAIGGFRVGDLIDHAVTGSISRALRLGRALQDGAVDTPEELARGLGAELLAVGRVVATSPEAAVPGVVTAELRTTDGSVVRLVARSEHIAFVRDGVVLAASPEIICVLDARTRAPLEVDEVAAAKDIVVLALPAPAWWEADERRLAEARPRRWGVEGLEVAG